MKKMFVLIAVVLLLCGIGMMVIAGIGKSAVTPSSVSVGYVVDGQYVQTNSGYIGGNRQAVKDMEGLMVLGGMTAVAGLACTVVACVFPKDGGNEKWT